jgi:adenylosuccinate synthase
MGPLPLQISIEEEGRRQIAEYGVTTGRRRKAAGLSWEHLDEAVMLNGPTQIALTFCDHLDAISTHARSAADLPNTVRRLIDKLQERPALPVTLCDCGKNFEQIVDLT